ncbi:hypothetical protein O1M54_16665 [Streptomyces diastatochromogenes]|nr:hypothetical protein [Streptomyces diastatochromogenes]
MRSHASQNRRRRRNGARPPGIWSGLLTTATALSTAAVIAVTGGHLPDIVQPVAATADTPGTTPADLKQAAQLREDQCRLNYVLRKAGPAMKEVARTGLYGTPEQLHTAANAEYWTDTPLSLAYDKDKAGSDAKLTELHARPDAWEKSLAVATPPPPYTVTGFQWVEPPTPFDKIGLNGWIADQFWKDEGDFYADVQPTASKDSVDAATTVYKARYSPDSTADYDDRQAWESLQFMHGMYADDARMFLQYGGFPTSAPDPDSMEFRIDVENLKSRFASCTWSNPQDPHSVLGEELGVAATEWQSELDGQKAQRNAILVSEAQANTDLKAASQALGEALGQSLIAARLTDWQAYWTKQKAADHPNDYPTKAEFDKVKKWITDAQGRASGRLFVASRAALDAKNAAADVSKAQDEAYAIADKAGLPRGRGLMYGQQAAQIAKASAAAPGRREGDRHRLPGHPCLGR